MLNIYFLLTILVSCLEIYKIDRLHKDLLTGLRAQGLLLVVLAQVGPVKGHF